MNGDLELAVERNKNKTIRMTQVTEDIKARGDEKTRRLLSSPFCFQRKVQQQRKQQLVHWRSKKGPEGERREGEKKKKKKKRTEERKA